MPPTKHALARPLEANEEKALGNLDTATTDLIALAIAAKPQLAGFKLGTPLGDLWRAVNRFQAAEETCHRLNIDTDAVSQ